MQILTEDDKGKKAYHYNNHETANGSLRLLVLSPARGVHAFFFGFTGAYGQQRTSFLPR
jgi:hypothetical protein